MKSVKTTVNIDEETWKQFKKTVSSRYGSIRNLSGAVEEAIKCFNTEELLSIFIEKAGIDAGMFPSLKEVKERRPKRGTSAGEIVRAMRDERVARISGHE